ncbi:MAG: hypothetical protein FJZ01_12640 [Candidatus Sericytochromatia bacterium]|nr:hypothetical protein [Candidatus Tanganyikabacteria bacterium]
MSPILRYALAAVVLTGCGNPAPAQLAAPDKVTTVATVPASAAKAPLPTEPVLADPVINPVAAKPATAPALQPALPAQPGNPQELGEAFKALRDGMTTKDGKPFNLFDMGEVPANAVIEKDASLAAPGLGFSVQAMPEGTQGKADKEAFKWASDAKEIYVGWGYAGRVAPLAFFGQSRHVYYSVEKSRLLYIDYNFFSFTKARWESDDIVLKLGGKYITWLLSEPRGRFPYNGREAFWEATKYGYSYHNRPKATIKAICISPLIIGPKWVFFDAVDKPIIIVDAADGEVRWDGWLIDILRLLFTFNP